MARHGKKYRKALEGVDRAKRYGLEEAVALVKSLAYAKYDESVEISVRLGIDAKKTDQLVRGSVVLPHGLGKKVRVLVFAKGDKEVEAREAGADFHGGDDLVEKVQGGWMEFDKVIAVSLKGPYLVTKYVAVQMKNQGRGGKVLNFGSTSGLVGRFDGIAYAAAKAGVINMTRAMAVQLAEYGIRVNCIVPNRSGSPVGYDDDVTGSRTFQNLAGRLGTADDQAKAALFLVSDDSSFIIGHPLIVDGGVMATANFPREQFQK